MTTIREAAENALDALSEIEWSNDSKWQSDRARVAIIALRASLAEPEQCERCDELAADKATWYRMANMFAERLEELKKKGIE